MRIHLGPLEVNVPKMAEFFKEIYLPQRGSLNDLFDLKGLVGGYLIALMAKSLTATWRLPLGPIKNHQAR